MDFNGGLSVGGSGEDLRLLGRDGGVALDQLGEDAAEGFQTQRQRRNVQQQNVLDVARENTALNCGAGGYAFIGVDALERLLAGEALDSFLNGGFSWHKRFP